MAKKYYTSSLSGLTVGVGDAAVRFQPFYEKFEGMRRKVGYLETEDSDVQKILKADINVIEISESDYKDATKKTARAPY